MSDAHEAIRLTYHRFADVECGEYSRLYFSLAHAVGNDDVLLEFLVGMPDPQPNLFFASVQYVADASAMPANGTELRTFVREHGAEVGRLMRSRHTQTNEIGRCAVLLPALPQGPLALVEVGASGGLCLLLDQFLYRYGSTEVGVRSSPVRLECAPVGSTRIPVPKVLPQILWRRGLDLNPVDLTDPSDVRWLRACIWSDHVERQERFDAAVRLAKSDRPLVHRGDLVGDLQAVVAEAPTVGTLIVFHSAVLPYVPTERREAFQEVLARLSSQRDIVWISNEGPGIIPALDSGAPERDELRFRLGRTTFSGGHKRQELLALGHPHGWDLEWLA